jgi:hypothetical protein
MRDNLALQTRLPDHGKRRITSAPIQTLKYAA